jgi:hypothetical protein
VPTSLTHSASSRYPLLFDVSYSLAAMSPRTVIPLVPKLRWKEMRGPEQAGQTATKTVFSYGSPQGHSDGHLDIYTAQNSLWLFLTDLYPPSF